MARFNNRSETKLREILCPSNPLEPGGTLSTVYIIEHIIHRFRIDPVRDYTDGRRIKPRTSPKHWPVAVIIFSVVLSDCQKSKTNVVRNERTTHDEQTREQNAKVRTCRLGLDGKTAIRATGNSRDADVSETRVDRKPCTCVSAVDIIVRAVRPAGSRLARNYSGTLLCLRRYC